MMIKRDVVESLPFVLAHGNAQLILERCYLFY